MLFTQWLSDVTDRVLRKRTRKLARKVTRRGRPISEALESRIVPTITVNVTGTMLTIAGDAGTGFDSHVTISFDSGTNEYLIDGNGEAMVDSSGTDTDSDADSGTLNIPKAGITAISVDLDDSTNGDTLEGSSSANTWTSTTLKVGAVTAAFSNVEILQGGSAADTFNIGTPASLEIFGGAGNDTFNINADVSGTLNGEDDDDTFVINVDSTSAVIDGGEDIDGVPDSDTLRGTKIDEVVLLTGAGGSHGFAGVESSISSFDNIDVLTGTGTTATLIGEDTDAPTWTLSGATSSYSNGLNSLIYNSAFRTLQGGGSVSDTFTVTSATTANVTGGVGLGEDVFDVNATLTGTLSGEDGADTFLINATVSGGIDGGEGIDTLDGTQINGVTLTGTDGTDEFSGDETSISGGFNHINVITGNGGTLKGINASSLWTLVDPAAFIYLDVDGTNSLTFGGFSTLQGGSEADEFSINTSVSLTLKGGLGDDTFTLEADLIGSINGEEGTDTLQGSAIDDVTLTGSGVNGLSGKEDSISGGFSGIDVLDASVSGGTFIGTNAASTWAVDSTDPLGTTYWNASLSTPVVINGFTKLQGGSAADTFNIIGDSAFDLDGGSGNDKIIFNNATLLGIATANGGDGNDTLDGQNATGPVSLQGGAGNDVVIGGAFNDTLDGGLGNDRLFGQAGDDTLAGGAGNDSIVGGADNDRLVETVNGNATITNTKMTGGNGTDTLSQLEEIEITGNTGNNTLDASAYTLGAVTLNGGDGNDTLSGGANVSMSGGDGIDVVKTNVSGTFTLSDGDMGDVEGVSITGSSGDDDIDASGYSGSVSISGGAGNDKITGGSGADALNGNAGDDEINGGAGNDSLLGGAGNDLMEGGADNDRITGNEGNDTIVDTGVDDTEDGGTNTSNDTISGDGGNDSINGGDGNDKIDAGAGNDTVFGENGTDNILGGAGLDSIEGGAGNDVLNGNADNDRIEGGEGNDQIFGGAGSDVLLGEEGDDNITSQGGNDTMLGGSGDDTLLGGAGSELMFGDSPDQIGSEEEGGNDLLNGGAGNDTLIGGDGDDSILGGAGNDLCLGGLGGNDTINGQAGTDTVYGGGDLDSLADGNKEALVKLPSSFIIPASVEGYQVEIDGVLYLSTHDYLFSGFDSTKFLDLDAI